MTTAAPRVPIQAYEAVKQISAFDVAAWLDLAPARERHKYACVWCESSDAMHVYQDGAKCYSCDQSGTVIDMVAAKYSLEPAEAVRALAERFGVLILDEPVGRQAASRPHAPAPRQPPAHTAAARPAPPADPAVADRVRLRQEVYAALLGVLTLTGRGADYLGSRGFTSPTAPIAEHFRSIDGRSDWARAWRLLEDQFGRDRVLDALMPLRERRRSDDPERYALPFGGRAAALVIPYRYRGAVVALRFRQLDEPRDKHNRYRDLGNSKSPLPFNADALDDLDGHDLHICEGELDAYTLSLVAPRLRVVGVPGVGQIPGDAGAPWLATAGTARRILCWYDPDKAGGQGASRLFAALREANGWSWIDAQQRVKRVAIQVDGYANADINDLYRAGHLSDVLSRLGILL